MGQIVATLVVSRVSNHPVVYLKLTECVNYTQTKKNNNNNKVNET